MWRGGHWKALPSGMRRISAGAILAAVVAATCVSCLPAHGWGSLPTTTGASPWAPSGVNADELVVGLDSLTNAVECTMPCDAPQSLLQPPGADVTGVVGVADDGTIAGNANNAAGRPQGVTWDPTDHLPTLLPIPAGHESATIRKIAPSGLAVGQATISGSASIDLYAWDAGTHDSHLLSYPSGMESVFPSGVSANGKVVGQGSDTVHNDGPVVLWTSVDATPVTLPLPPSVTYLDSPIVNDDGTVAASSSDNPRVAYVWDATTHLPTQLVLPDGYTNAWPRVINDSGEIIGTAQDANGKSVGVAWSAGGFAPTVLATPTGAQSFAATGLNADGLIVGYATQADGTNTAVTWSSPSAAPVALATATDTAILAATRVAPDGTVTGAARVIHDAPAVWGVDHAYAPLQEAATITGNTRAVASTGDGGEVVGEVLPSLGLQRGLDWPTPQAAPVVLTPEDASLSDAVTGVAADGLIIGYEYRSSGPPISPDPAMQALAWTSSSAAPQVLPVPSGYAGVRALAVNEHDLIVGCGSDASSLSHAVAWSSLLADPTVLASPSGFTGVCATAVNADGTIVGKGSDSSGYVHPLLWHDTSSSPVELDLLDGATSGTVVSINGQGTVLGTSFAPGQAARIVEWDATTRTVSEIAPPVGATNLMPVGIDDSGRIYVNGTTELGVQQVFSWAP